MKHSDIVGFEHEAKREQFRRDLFVAALQGVLASSPNKHPETAAKEALSAADAALDRYKKEA